MIKRRKQNCPGESQLRTRGREKIHRIHKTDDGKRENWVLTVVLKVWSEPQN